jgi:ABC-type lipoprotein release transport system permease subunit
MIGILIAAWLDVRSKPLRTVAAIAGMVAAIVAVVLVDAAGVLSRDANDEYRARNYGLEVTVAINSAGGEITPEDAARLHEVLVGNGIAYLSPNVTQGVLLEDGGSLGPATLSWVSSAYPDIRVVDMLYGSWPVDTAQSDVAHVVITEQRARELGFSGPEAVGQVMHYTLRDSSGSGDIRTDPLRPMIIDGVASTTTNAFDSISIMIVSDLPRPELMPEFGGMSWLARVNPIDQGTLQNLVSSVTDESGSPLFQSQRIDQSAQLAPVLDQQAVTARVVTLVALTVGGLGILGVGLTSVRERGKDFGLRRALGASKLRIFAGVIVQTLLEVVLAAAIAIFIAAIALELYARDLVLDRLPLPASTALPLSSAALGLAGALLVGLVAGLIPAFSAARASVVQALKG